MHFLRWNGKPELDIFRDSNFADFRASLDSEMKRLQSEGYGTKTKQAEVLTEEDEDILWEKGILGSENPQSLLNSVIFYNGLYFTLCSGREHRQLQSHPCHIEIVEHPCQWPYLSYSKDVSKNHQGELKGQNIKPKVEIHHSNDSNPDRCFVRLFKCYRKSCPNDAFSHAFYLQPSRVPTDTCWYTRCPVGHNTLGTAVA